MQKTPKRPRDPNQLAHFITQIATGEVTEADPDAKKDPAAVALVEAEEAQADRKRGPYKKLAA
jgi:hypothetical protein